MFTIKKNIKRQYSSLFFTSIVVLFVSFLIIGMLWVKKTYSNLNIEQLIFFRSVPTAGAPSDFVILSYIKVFVIPFCITVFYFFSALFFKQALFINLKKKQIQIFPFFIKPRPRNIFLFITVWLLVFLGFWQCKIKFFTYVYYQYQPETDLYSKYYVDPSKVEFTFPAKKKNLIFLYLESVEASITAKEYGGLLPYDTIPELRKIAEENLSFSHGEKLGGATQVLGTSHSLASLVNTSLGVPEMLPPFFSENLKSHFFTGGYGLGDILFDNGYTNIFISSSCHQYGYQDVFVKNHKNFSIFDLNHYRSIGKLDKDYQVWWGFEDSKLFQFAKEELAELSEKEEPFFLMLFTGNTHTPKGYLEKDAEKKFKNQIHNVFADSSKQVGEFIQWLKKQSFYEDSVIVILGDHQYMGDDLYSKNIKEKDRHTYNAIINSQVHTVQTKNRVFATFDFYPTIVEALGIRFHAKGLGLGRSLFSGEKTLLEEIGVNKFNEEIQRRSSFYQNHIIQKK
ncbi:MAG: LTA synthase family protein [Treponema phagedenis]|uniref:LTA synthase family protein n=1 Tax=Treponema phagedenis TaxID=162 RepID=UPI003133F79D